MKKVLILAFVLTFTTINHFNMIPKPEDFKTINEHLIDSGIENPKVRIAIIGLIGTEGGFNIREEKSYRNTSSDRLRKIFGNRLAKFTDEQIDIMKLDDQKFFEIIYGNRFGNTSPCDGFKFRGRGYNQLTFKGNYERYGKMIGMDLVSNPDLVNKPEVAIKVLAAYFIDLHETGQRSGILRRKFNVTDWKNLKDQKTINRLICQMNAGWGTNITGSIFPQKLSKMDSFVDTIATTYHRIV